MSNRPNDEDRLRLELAAKSAGIDLEEFRRQMIGDWSLIEMSEPIKPQDFHKDIYFRHLLDHNSLKVLDPKRLILTPTVDEIPNMTESEWLQSPDPQRMLAWLTGHGTGQDGFGNDPQAMGSGKPSDRKLRLFACVTEPSFEKWSDLDVLKEIDWLQTVRKIKMRPDHAAALREVFGNPFRPARCEQCLLGVVPTDREDNTCETCGGTGKLPKRWLTPTVKALAETAYAERDEATGHLDAVRLLVLADALEEAGCSSEDMLRHLRGYEPCWLCRQVDADPVADACSVCGQLGSSGEFGRPCAPGWVASHKPHVRGCWALDLILEKE